jgi:hypothetical protein
MIAKALENQRLENLGCCTMFAWLVPLTVLFWARSSLLKVAFCISPWRIASVA